MRASDECVTFGEAQFTLACTVGPKQTASRTASGQAGLHPEVGLGFVYVTQSVDEEIQWAGSIGVLMVRRAQEREQSASITAALVRLLR